MTIRRLGDGFPRVCAWAMLCALPAAAGCRGAAAPPVLAPTDDPIWEDIARFCDRRRRWGLFGAWEYQAGAATDAAAAALADRARRDGARVRAALERVLAADEGPAAPFRRAGAVAALAALAADGDEEALAALARGEGAAQADAEAALATLIAGSPRRWLAVDRQRRRRPPAARRRLARVLAGPAWAADEHWRHAVAGDGALARWCDALPGPLAVPRPRDDADGAIDLDRFRHAVIAGLIARGATVTDDDGAVRQADAATRQAADQFAGSRLALGRLAAARTVLLVTVGPLGAALMAWAPSDGHLIAARAWTPARPTLAARLTAWAAEAAASWQAEGGAAPPRLGLAPIADDPGGQWRCALGEQLIARGFSVAADPAGDAAFFALRGQAWEDPFAQEEDAPREHLRAIQAQVTMTPAWAPDDPEALRPQVRVLDLESGRVLAAWP